MTLYIGKSYDVKRVQVAALWRIKLMIGKVMLVLHMPSAKDLCFIVICQKNDVEDVEFFRTDPATESEHLQLCKEDDREYTRMC
ncbi:MAG: hypothetical protein IIC69_00480 [Nanoarchaeota archaeon]|nr:hypothetical protein [Nanoarchaeota archaeon]